VMQAVQALRDAAVDVNVLSVVNPDTDGRTNYLFFRSMGIKQINFLLPDYSYDTFPGKDLSSYNAQCFAFMRAAFDSWFEEDNTNVIVTYFNDLISVLLGGKADLCTMQLKCPNFITVEQDGRVNHCDVARLCGSRNYDTGLTIQQPLDAINQNEFHKALLTSSGLCKECLDCELLFACGGHCPGTRYSSQNGLDNVSIFCSFFKSFIPYVRKRIAERIPLPLRSKLLVHPEAFD